MKLRLAMLSVISRFKRKRHAARIGLFCAGLLIVTGSWAGTGSGKVSTSFPSLQSGSRRSPGVAVQRGAQWQETNQAQNGKLRAEALENLEVRLTAQFKNPRILSSGLDPAVFTSIQEPPVDSPSDPRTVNSKRSRAARSAVAQPSSKQFLSASPCNTPMIRSVNGNREGAVFTPKAPGNVYRIEGCSFGSVRGRIQLELRPVVSGQPASFIALQLDDTGGAWSDQAITAHLNSQLSGISDSPVTLAIYPANGTRLELPGCLFVALRGEPQLLKVIPAAWVRLDATRVRSRALEQLEYVSPPVNGNQVPKDAAGTSAIVVRSDSERFVSGSDRYDFSNLAQGWVVHSVQLQTYSIACPADVTYSESFGRWDLTWEERGFTVNWGGDACKSYPVPFFNFSLSFSQYAAKVWVIGPVGTQPVAGFAR
jgi:hypothetical protein